jgi:hypothetical protein
MSNSFDGSTKADHALEVGSTEFYRRVVDVIEIPDSTPGIYIEGWLNR